MKIALAITLAMFAVVVGYTSPIPPAGIHGRYNKISHLAYCDNRDACLHEIGHRLDQAAGYPSQTKEFGDAINVHVAVALHAAHPDTFSMQILCELTGYTDTFPIKSELYANLFMTVGGKAENMPPDLRPFYDWQLADRLMRRLRLGETLYWLGN